MSKNTKLGGKMRMPYISRLEFVLTIVFGCLNIVLFAILAEVFDTVNSAVFAVGLTIIYLAEILILKFRKTTETKILHRRNIHDLLAEDGSVVLKNSMSPVVAIDYHGTILWYNDSMRSIRPDGESLVGDNITNIFDEESVAKLFESPSINLGNRIYQVEGFTVSDSGDGLYVLMLTDVTELRDSEKRYIDERVAVAYIAIDNVEDALQYVHEKYKDAVSTVDEKLKAWASSINAVIKSYDNDKYIMLFDSKHLDECISDRFSVLDKIRETRVGDEVSITVSIGVSRIKGSLAERELAAKEAIDMALQRGGDQAVYKSENTIDYYGGRTKSVYKRSNVKSRTFTTKLTSLLARADNVIVMGHRYGDFDSFGASVGVVRLCMLCGIKANIAIDMRDKNLEPCIRLLQGTNDFAQVFVDNAEGLDLVGPDTLVILVDHSSIARAQFANIANKVETIAVIDHHRSTEAMPPVVKLHYIEPSASSACELVSEMLENAISSHNLSKEVADILLAGVLLDTKQFTRNTGTRTFSVAQYLRGAGASPSDVYDLFKTPPSELSKEARFHTAITTYRDNIAISSCDGDTDETYRVIASKAADKMLTLRGIAAAFTLVRIGEQIHISGRSNGTINVQLILEKLNGGGHFDVAGAQVISDSVETVLDALKESIDDYLGV